MATRINNFITQIGQGVKPNMFSVDIRFPGSNLSAGTVSDAAGAERLRQDDTAAHDRRF